MDAPTPRPDPFSQATPSAVWVTVLRAGSPRAVLALLVDGDPLQLRERCYDRIRRQALLLDLHRLHLRTAAHVARHASEYAGAPPLDVWLASHIRRAVQELVAEDAAGLRSDEPVDLPRDPRILALADFLGIEPNAVLRGCAAFNQAPSDVRGVFQEVVLDGHRSVIGAGIRTSRWRVGARSSVVR